MLGLGRARFSGMTRRRAPLCSSGNVVAIRVLNDLPCNAVPGGVMVELGDFYAGEARKLLIELAVPAMAALGLATIAELTLRYVALPALQQHTATLPISVNVVPADLAAKRVPAPVVHREKLLLSAQQAKRTSKEALDRGDHAAARSSLEAAKARLMTLHTELRDDAVESEISWLTDTIDGLDSWDEQYSIKRLRSDATMKSRGFTDRQQGGEVA